MVNRRLGHHNLPFFPPTRSGAIFLYGFKITTWIRANRTHSDFLFRSRQFFNLASSASRVSAQQWSLEFFNGAKPDRLAYLITGSKSFNRVLFVFVDTANQMRGDAHIKIPVSDWRAY
jgi:hypothetical protein